MARNLQINTGVIVRQEQAAVNPVILPNQSVTANQLTPAARISLQNASLVVGSAADVANGIADYSSIVAAEAALPNGGKILVRNTYTAAEALTSTASNLHIEGQGHLTVLGGLTFSGDYNSIINLKHGDLFFGAGSDKNLVNGTWLASGATVTDNGLGNELRYVQE